MPTTPGRYRDDAVALAAPLPAVDVPVLDAVGHVLAEEVRAPRPMPAFDSSALDGYAALAADATAGAVLPVAGEVAAGGGQRPEVRPGRCVRVLTGAWLPPGAEVVVPVEDVEQVGGPGGPGREPDGLLPAGPGPAGSPGPGGPRAVRVLRAPRPGGGVRRAGEGMAAGAVVAPAGRLVTPAVLAALVAAERAAVSVVPRPRVVVASTGDELVEPGLPAEPPLLPDSNGPAVAAVLRAAGALVTRTGPLPDDAAAVAAALDAAAAGADLVVTTGGVSMGAEHDTVRAVLSARPGVSFVRVALQPGKPQALGRLGGTVFLGLPGNPVSAVVSAVLFAVPVVRRLRGLDPVVPALRLPLAVGVRALADRTRVVTGVRGADGVRPAGGYGSHLVATLGVADCLLVLPPGEGDVPAGSVVDVLPLPGEEEPWRS